MLLRLAVLEAIRDGRVDLAFRRWKRPRVLAGTRMRTALGLVEVIGVEVVERGAITEADARRAGHRSAGELLEMLDSRDEGEIHRVELRWAGADPRVELRERDDLSSAELDQIAARLERLDHVSRRGPWTRTVLELIRDRPEVRAPDLAESLGLETQPFKRDVRKLKELGLTESLEIGYRLSPRGRTVLERRRTERA
ncbi:MAG: hypothetical protein ABW135_18235 [Thermoleophilaceae bacterium]